MNLDVSESSTTESTGMPCEVAVCDPSPIAGECCPPEPRSLVAPWHVSAVFCALMLLVGLTGYGLLDPDEGRYAEIPREMLETGDFVTPRLNYVPYLEKPPLMYWATAGAFKLLGTEPWVLRLVPALCGILGMLVAWWLARLCFCGHCARWAPSIIASSVLYFIMARIPVIDMMFSMLLAAALTAWLAGEHREKAARYWLWLVSGLLLGGAVLSKGPTALVLFGAIIVVYLLWTRRPLMIVAGAGLPVIVAVAAFLPWVLAIQRATPEFYHYFFVVQHVQRFLGNGLPEHVKPFYYYLLVLPLGFMLWSFYWPGMGRNVLRHRWADVPAPLRRDAAFLIIWVVVTVLFFSASSCKLAQYILPVWWPISAVMAAWLRREFCISNPRKRLYVPTVLQAVFVALMMAGMIIWAGRQDLVPALRLQRPLLIFVAAGVVSFSLLMFTSWLSNRHWSIAQLTIGAILPFMGLLPAMHVVTSVKDMNGLIPPQIMNLPKDTRWTMAQYDCYNQSFGFYTRQRVIVIDDFNETSRVGLKQPDAHKWFRKGEKTIAELSAKGPLALGVRTEDAERIAKAYKLHIYASNDNRATLFNDAGWKLLKRPASTSKAGKAVPGSTGAAPRRVANGRA